MQTYDKRNDNILIHVGGELLKRADAKVSVFDSTVQGGDAVWEGIRVYKNSIFQLDNHLNRLQASAKAMAFKDIPNKEDIRKAIFETLEANGMKDESHIRLTLSRGIKITSGMDPLLNQSGACLIVLAEWKAPIYDTEGIKLITSSIRRNNAQCIDSKIHHNNLINNILAKIEANVAGVDDAVMLDLNGFVSETNATNIFLVKNGVLLTPHADSCLPGITRSVVIQIAKANNMEVIERNISISEMYTADECFTTGTMGELSPVTEVDGRDIYNQGKNNMTAQLLELYLAKAKSEGEQLPF